MAAAGLLALLDDIASILDDVALLTKVATRKTAGVLGDDLALNAQQVTGVSADRELPVVWAVAKGSALNKAILVPAALAVSAFLPWAIVPLLMVGGAFLCYEGFEKLAHRFLYKQEERTREHEALQKALADPAVDPVAFEQARIKGAIRTDFILSAEIVVIALGIVADAPLPTRIAVLVLIAIAMTAGVYGIVAGIVKLDDLGLWLRARPGVLAQAIGTGILRATPWLMKFLSVAGTAAMFLVGGGILVHGVPALHHHVEALGERTGDWAGMGGVAEVLAPMVANMLVGIVAGAVLLLVVTSAQRLRQRRAAA